MSPLSVWNRLSRLREIIGPNSYRSLGRSQYLRMITEMGMGSQGIVSRGDFRELDRRMSQGDLEVNFRDTNFCVPALRLDEIIADGTYTFGAIRELFLRDCYFRLLPARSFHSISTAVDIGANRGLVTVALGQVAARVLAVEAQPARLAAIETAVSILDCDVVIDCKMVGGVGALDVEGVPQSSAIGMRELLDEHQFDTVDFVKLDIEGSEFGLFDSIDWLDRVRMVAMEVHPKFGNPSWITDRLASAGFQTLSVNDYFSRPRNSSETAFIGAWRA